jgi:acyl-CoA synthetase (NDP forming)
MVPGGVPVEVRAVEDPLFGPLLSVGVSGVPTDLLGDRAWRIPPLTDRDAATMVRELRAAPLLLGWRGRPPADLSALEDLLHRVSRLLDDFPEVAALSVEPALVATRGLHVVGAAALVSAPAPRSDWFTRRLSP